jgi:hypothetical protein
MTRSLVRFGIIVLVWSVRFLLEQLNTCPNERCVQARPYIGSPAGFTINTLSDAGSWEHAIQPPYKAVISHSGLTDSILRIFQQNTYPGSVWQPVWVYCSECKALSPGLVLGLSMLAWLPVMFACWWPRFGRDWLLRSGCDTCRVCDQTFICAQSQALLGRCIGIVEWKGYGKLLMGGVIPLHCGREIIAAARYLWLGYIFIVDGPTIAIMNACTYIVASASIV